MKYLKHLVIFLLFTPIISFIIWLFSNHIWINFINTLFYVSMLLAIVFFIILILQKGILDPTSFGFRRLKYQLTTKKERNEFKHAEFYKPTQLKKDFYIIFSWL